MYNSCGETLYTEVGYKSNVILHCILCDRYWRFPCLVKSILFYNLCVWHEIFTYPFTFSIQLHVLSLAYNFGGYFCVYIYNHWMIYCMIIICNMCSDVITSLFIMSQLAVDYHVFAVPSQCGGMCVHSPGVPMERHWGDKRLRV